MSAQLAAVARSILLRRVAAVLLESFRNAGISALAYKGPALALHAYGSLAARRFVDLDLIVRPRDFARARDVLLSLGYRTDPASAARMPRAMALTCTNDETLVDDVVAVELHWAVTPPWWRFPLDTEVLFSRAIKLETRELTAMMPCNEDMVLLLAMNGTKDAWANREIVRSLALLSQKPGFRWSLLLEQTDAIAAARILHVGLGLAQRLERIEMPVEARDRIASDHAARRIVDRLLADAPERRLSNLERVMFVARSRERLRDRAMFLAGRALSPGWKDVEALALPEKLWPLYYGVRPLRLLGVLRRGGLTG